jgi:hypothetical protein
VANFATDASKLGDMSTTTEIARLKVTLEDVEPAVVRRLEVPFGIRLDRLHAVLQASLGWTNSHFWEFRAGDVGWGIPDKQWGDGPQDASKATLRGVIEATFTTTATAGSTPSGSSASARLCQENSILASSMPRGVARPKTSAGLRVMPSFSRPWQIPTMTATPNSRNGTTPTSIRTLSMC